MGNSLQFAPQNRLIYGAVFVQYHKNMRRYPDRAHEGEKYSCAEGAIVICLTIRANPQKHGKRGTLKKFMAKLCFPVVLLCLLLTAAAEAEGPAITQAWLDGNQVTVTISGGQENTTILCAAYKHDGRMVYADTRSADGETASFTLNSAAEYDKVRVFAADGDYRPLCPAVEAKEGNFNTLMEIDTGLSDAFGRPVVHGYRGNEDLGE